MTIWLIISLLFSNSVTLKQDRSILFSRTVINNTLLISFLICNNLYIYRLDNEIDLFGGLFQVTSFTQTIKILIVTGLKLILNSLYPKYYTYHTCRNYLILN